MLGWVQLHVVALVCVTRTMLALLGKLVKMALVLLPQALAATAPVKQRRTAPVVQRTAPAKQGVHAKRQSV